MSKKLTFQNYCDLQQFRNDRCMLMQAYDNKKVRTAGPHFRCWVTGCGLCRAITSSCWLLRGNTTRLPTPMVVNHLINIRNMQVFGGGNNPLNMISASLRTAENHRLVPAGLSWEVWLDGINHSFPYLTSPGGCRLRDCGSYLGCGATWLCIYSRSGLCLWWVGWWCKWRNLYPAVRAFKIFIWNFGPRDVVENFRWKFEEAGRAEEA